MIFAGSVEALEGKKRQYCFPPDSFSFYPYANAMSSTPDEISVEYEENGRILIKELDKVVLSKGAWTTILFRYQELDQETDMYGPDKYTIRRYKKSGGEYRQQSKFNISSAKQAQDIIDALSRWLAEKESSAEE